MEVGASVASGKGGMVQREVNVLPLDASNGASVLRGGAFPALPPSSSSSTSPSDALAVQAFVPLYSVPHSQVMTEEQLETLRRQISVYATICQQLVEMHKAVMAQQSTIQGLRLGQPMPFDAILHSGHKLTARQRWTPSQTQLQILERLFEQGNGTPSKQKIKEITLELSHHGQISETNVYNWFQNRRARTKRKQQVGGFNNGESELDTDGDSPEEKKNKTERDLSNESIMPAYEETNYQDWNTNECHPLEGPREIFQRSQAMQMDSSGAGFKAPTFHTHEYMPEGVFLEDRKVWDVTMIDRKPDTSVGPSVSQDSQGQMLILNGPGQSMRLSHTTKGFNIAP